MEVAFAAKNPRFRFVLIGLCSDYAVGYYTERDGPLHGRFLSIYEESDSKSSCKKIFNRKEGDSFEFEEIALRMGIDHAFLFKPYREWVEPLTRWVREGIRK